jgi:hypothetical protein
MDLVESGFSDGWQTGFDGGQNVNLRVVEGWMTLDRN